MTALIIGNWKMNGLKASLETLKVISQECSAKSFNASPVICPPATLLDRFCAAAAGSGVRIGAQDCHEAGAGAHTGDISAQMLKDAGAWCVLIGHSERRTAHSETGKQICAKLEAAASAGLVPVLCIGETLKEREAGETKSVLTRQMEEALPKAATDLIIAYEPVWAIGSGRTPDQKGISEAHAHIRACLVKAYDSRAEQIPILYGGSVSPANAAAILKTSGVGGALVGGASLKASDFLAILGAL